MELGRQNLDRVLRQIATNQGIACFFLDSSSKSTTGMRHTDLQHLLFLSVCIFIKSDIHVVAISDAFQYGGMIGYGNATVINKLARVSKVMRLHAALHDAYGFMKDHFDAGPGYSYVHGMMPNWFFVGHMTGMFYWLCVKVFYRELYNNIVI